MRNSNKEDWSSLLTEDPQGAAALWDMSDGFGESAEVDVSKAWAQFEQRLEDRLDVPKVRVRRFPWKRFVTAAAAAVGLLLVINFFSGSTTTTQYANVGASAKTILLEDNSTVALSEGASLSVRMEDNVRMIELLGEASFDVTSNPDRPFKVSTPELDLIVVGTSFRVMSGSSAGVIVREGHVRVRGHNEADWTDIRAGESASITNTLVVAEETEPTAPVVPLRFEAVALSQVVKSIELAHDIQLVIPNKLANCSLTADFTQNSVSEIASSLALLFSADMSVIGQTFELKGGHCQ